MAAVPEEFGRDFESAYRANYPLLHRRSRRFFPAEEAEDAVQETFLRAWTHHHGRDPGIPWMMTVLRNLAIDRSRRKTADPVADIETLDRPTEDTAADQVIYLEERRALHRAMEDLTEAQRQALKLREWHGLSHKEVAKSLGTTVSGVESLLVRGKRRLRSALEGAMAMILWPATSLWRKVRHLPAQTDIVASAAPGAVSALTTTVAQLVTAAAIIVAGAAYTPGGGGTDGGGIAPADGSRSAVTASLLGTSFGKSSSDTSSGGESSALPLAGAPAAGSDQTTGGSGDPAASPPSAGGGGSGGGANTIAAPSGNETLPDPKTAEPPKDTGTTGPGSETPDPNGNETGEPPQQPVIDLGSGGVDGAAIPTAGA